MNQERVDQLIEIFKARYTVDKLRKLASNIGLVNARDNTVVELRRKIAEFMQYRNIDIPEEFRHFNKMNNRKKTIPTADGERAGRNRRLTRDVRELNQMLIDYLVEEGLDWRVTFNDQVRDDISSMFLISPPEVTGVSGFLELALDGKKKTLRKSEWWTKECFVETRREKLADVLEAILIGYKELNNCVIKFKLWQDLLLAKSSAESNVLTVYTINVDEGANCSMVVNYDENELREQIQNQIVNLMSYYQGDAMIKTAGSGFVIDSYSPVNLQIIDVIHGEDSYELRSFQPFPEALIKRKGLINVLQKEDDWSTDQCFMMNMAVCHYLKDMEVRGGYNYDPHSVNGIKPYVEAFKKYNNMKKYDEFVREIYPDLTVNIFLYKDQVMKDNTKTVVKTNANVLVYKRLGNDTKEEVNMLMVGDPAH